jgi:hypothetical protein
VVEEAQLVVIVVTTGVKVAVAVKYSLEAGEVFLQILM